MSLFEIQLDVTSGRFEQQFPITLQEKGVTPQEYFTTLNTCSEIASKAHEQHARIQWKFSMLIFIVLIAGIFLFMTPFVIIILCSANRKPNIPVLIILPICAGLGINFAIFFTIRARYNSHKFHHSETKKRIEEYLQNENMRLYYNKGVQFILKYDVNGYAEYLSVYHSTYIANGPSLPTLQILTSYGSGAAMVQQPQYLQEYMPQPVMYGAPAEVYNSTQPYQNYYQQQQ
jgi:ABC-type multidrug transport system fused ATPase/permease subunit